MGFETINLAFPKFFFFCCCSWFCYDWITDHWICGLVPVLFYL